MAIFLYNLRTWIYGIVLHRNKSLPIENPHMDTTGHMMHCKLIYILNKSIYIEKI